MPGRPDYYWNKSKEHGYPARSVWKLLEMQERFRLLDAGPRVLDLGCSPGSWSLAALEILANRGTVTGVDLDEPDPKLMSRPGFAFRPDAKNPFGAKGLTGRSARVVVTMGMPALVYRWIYRAHSVRSLERNVLGFVGIGPVRETLIGSTGNLQPEDAKKWRVAMRKLGVGAQ